MKMRKRLFSLLLIAAMIAGMMYLPSYAASEEETADTAQTYSDMPDNWARTALLKAVENGLLVGSGDKILPNEYLTRAQMAAVIVRAFGATAKADLKGISDIKSTDWYAGSMAQAYQMGVIFGSNGKMYPLNKITRQEACAILARAFKLKPSVTINKSFKDLDQISEWARADVYAVVNGGYIAGNNGILNPKGYVTRAQFAQIFDNFIKQYVKKAGEYTTVADGNVMVNAPGVTLKNLRVSGDLIIGDGVGDGEVTLNNVTVAGRTVIRGGGANSVKVLGNSSLQNIIIARVGGQVRVYSEDGTEIGQITVDGSDDVIIEGNAGSVTVLVDDITLTLRNAQVDSLILLGEDTNLDVGAGSSVERIQANSDGASIGGQGDVGSVNANGDNIIVTTPGTQVTAGSGATGVIAGTTPVPGGTSVNTPGNPPPAGGGGFVPPSVVDVSSIAVKGAGNATSVELNSTLQMVAEISPSNAANKTLTWSVAPTSGAGAGTASINASTGVLTGTGIGTVIVTATANNGVKGTATITIVVGKQPVISNVSISSNSAKGTNVARNGDTITLTFISDEPVTKLSNFKINGSNPDTFTNIGNVYAATHLVDSGDIITGQPATFQINVKNEKGVYSTTVEETTDGSSVTIVDEKPVISNVRIESNSTRGESEAWYGDIITLTFTSDEPVTKLSNFKINGSNPDTFTNVGNEYTATHLVDAGDIVTGQPATFQINVKNSLGIYSLTVEETNDSSFVVITEPMEIISNMPLFTAGVPQTFTIGTEANNDAGKMVRAHFTLPDGVTVEYREGGVGDWIKLTNVFGPESGFPLGNISTEFRGTFQTASNYIVIVEFREIGTNKVLGSKELAVAVDPVIEVENVSVTNATEVTIGSTLNLTAVVTPDDATFKTVVWSLANGTGEATLNGNVLTPVKAGTVTVTATAGGKSGTAVITIENEVLSGSSQLGAKTGDFTDADGCVSKTDALVAKGFTFTAGQNRLTVSGSIKISELEALKQQMYGIDNVFAGFTVENPNKALYTKMSYSDFFETNKLVTLDSDKNWSAAYNIFYNSGDGWTKKQNERTMTVTWGNDDGSRTLTQTLTFDATDVEIITFADDEESLAFVLPQDFSVGKWSGVSGYNVGFKLLQCNSSNIAAIEISLYKDDVVLSTNTATAALLTLNLSELSSPFNVNGSFTGDEYWSYGTWSGTFKTVPNKAVIKVTDKAGYIYTVSNTSLAGDPSALYTFRNEEAADFVVPENFNTHSGVDYKGLNVGFRLVGLNVSDLGSIEVSLFNGSTLLAKNTANTSFMGLDDSNKQHSTPFMIQAGYYQEEYWTLGEHLLRAALKPDRAEIRIIDKDSKIYIVENNNLAEPDGVTYESLFIVDVTPVVITNAGRIYGDLWGSITAGTMQESKYTDVEVKFSEDIHFTNGDVVVSYWTKDINGNYVEIKGSDGRTIVKSKLWGGYLTEIATGVKAVNLVKADTIYGTAINSTNGGSGYATEAWWVALWAARDSGRGVWVKFEVTDDWGNKSITYAPIAAVRPMEIIAELPEFKAWVPATFTIGTIANGDKDKLVRACFTLPAGVTVEYREGGVGAWIKLTDVFGPATGFPLADITTEFRGTFEAAGSYTVKVEFKEVATNVVLGSKNISVTVAPPLVFPAAKISTIVPSGGDVAAIIDGDISIKGNIFVNIDGSTNIEGLNFSTQKPGLGGNVNYGYIGFKLESPFDGAIRLDMKNLSGTVNAVDCQDGDGYVELYIPVAQKNIDGVWSPRPITNNTWTLIWKDAIGNVVGANTVHVSGATATAPIALSAEKITVAHPDGADIAAITAGDISIKGNITVNPDGSTNYPDLSFAVQTGINPELGYVCFRLESSFTGAKTLDMKNLSGTVDAPNAQDGDGFVLLYVPVAKKDSAGNWAPRPVTNNYWMLTWKDAEGNILGINSLHVSGLPASSPADTGN